MQLCVSFNDSDAVSSCSSIRIADEHKYTSHAAAFASELWGKSSTCGVSKHRCCIATPLPEGFVSNAPLSRRVSETRYHLPSLHKWARVCIFSASTCVKRSSALTDRRSLGSNCDGGEHAANPPVYCFIRRPSLTVYAGHMAPCAPAPLFSFISQHS